MRCNKPLTLLVLCCSFQCQADTAAIGYVKVLSGAAWLTSDGQRLPAAVGSAIVLGQQISTGNNASLGITFKDETIISIGPDTTVTVDEFLYAPAKDSLKLSANLLKGTLQYISGVIAKLKPEGVAVRTPSGVIGVRGTRFLVKVDD